MDIIEWITMKILNVSYLEVHGNCLVQNIRLKRTHKKDRNKYVDFMIKYKNNIIILELNNNFNGSSIRNIVFAMTEIINHYSRNNNTYYKDMIRVYLVNLNWHKSDNKLIFQKRIDKVYSLENLSKGLFFEVININLDKYVTINYNKIDTKEKFYKLLTIDNKKELIEFSKEESLLKEYVEKLIKISKNRKEENMTELMEENILREESYHFGKEDGIKEGIEQKENDIILNMFNNKFDLNIISKIVKLPIKRIKEIIKCSNNK